MKKVISSLFLVILLLAPVASPALAAPRDRDGSVITRVVRIARLLARSLGDILTPPLPQHP